MKKRLVKYVVTLLAGVTLCACGTTSSSSAASILSGNSSSSTGTPDSGSTGHPSTTDTSRSDAISGSDETSSSSQGTSSSSSQGGTSSSSQGTSSSSSQGGTSSSTSHSVSSDSSSSSSSPATSLPAIDYIKVFCETSWTYTYAWTTTNGTTELVGKWPGTLLESYNDKWKTYDFKGYTSLNIIFNKGNGQAQTSDLSIATAGYWWYYNSQWYQSEPQQGGSSSSSSQSGASSTSSTSSSSTASTHPSSVSYSDDQTLISGNNKYHTANPWDDPEWGVIPKRPDSYPVKATYNDFDIWNDSTVSWNTVSPYKGQRKDFRQESIYFCITTRFYNADTTNDMHDWDENKATPATDPAWRGDFKGLIEKMDYIKALGFTSIWITPVVENCSGLDYHGYHAFNFNKVDPRYESTDVSFQEVIKEAHSRDMKIVLDVVWNHNGNFGEDYLLKEFTKDYDKLLGGSSTCANTMIPTDRSSSYPTNAAYAQYQERLDLMKGIKRTSDGKSAQQDPNYYWHHYGEFGWEKYNEQLAQIAGDCVDLNTENPVVAEYLLRAYGQFIHMGVDAFRVDTMKQINRYTLNQYYIGAFKKYAEKCGNSNFFMFGEVCARCSDAWNHGVPAVSAPFYTWKETKSYDWGDAWTNVISSVQAAKDESLDTYGGNVPASELIAKQPTSTNAILDGVSYHTPDYTKASGTSVIDFPMHWSFGSAQGAFNMGKSEDKYYNDSTWNVVYVNSHDYSPDSNYIPTYSDSQWCEDFDLMFTFRGIPCMYYGTEIKFQAGKVIDNGGNEALINEGRAYYGDNLEGTVSASAFGTYTASGTVATTLQSTISQHVRKLNKIRQSVPALQMGQYTTAGVSGNMAYVRRYTSGSTDSLACVAISGAASFSNLPAGTYVDVVSGKSQVVGTAGTLSVSGLSTANMAVYVLQNASTGTLGQIGGATTYLA